MSPLRQIRHITGWFDRNIDIPAGSDWEHEIETQLATANIILLLISANFFASKYLYSIEMQQALERHKAGTAHVIPIILRPVDWEITPIGKLQALPTGKKPVTLWTHQDEAWLDIEQGIRHVIRTLLPGHILSRHETSLLSKEKKGPRIQHPVTPSLQKISSATFKSPTRMQEPLVPIDRKRILKDRKAGFNVTLQKDDLGQYGRKPEKVRSNKKKHILVPFIGILLLLVLIICVSISNGVQDAAQNDSYATNTAQADNATAQTFASTSRTAYPPKNTSPVLDDPLKDNSKGNNWEIDDPSKGNCKFANGTYDINTNALEWCLAESTNFANFIYEVQIKIVKGSGGGILFRSDLTGVRQGYYFVINQEGSCNVNIYTSDNYDTVLAPCSGWPIRRGLNQTNVLAAIVYRNVIELYINHQLVAVVGNSTFTHGRIGMIVAGSDSEQTEVMFQNAKVWKL